MTRCQTIVADPPWPFKWDGRAGGRRARSTDLGYELMEYEAIRLLPVASLAAPHATLFLWTTQDALHRGEARSVALRWGFPERVGEIVWRKPNFGAGAFPRIGHETCLIYRRGKGSLRPGAPRNVHSVQTWAQPYAGAGGKIHSAKPDGFYDLVEQGHTGPYLELFARRARMGDWHYWGDQSFQTAEMAA